MVSGEYSYLLLVVLQLILNISYILSLVTHSHLGTCKLLPTQFRRVCSIGRHIDQALYYLWKIPDSYIERKMSSALVSFGLQRSYARLRSLSIEACVHLSLFISTY